jgi:integrase
MALTVKKHAKLVRRGQVGRHLDGPPNGVRGLYLVVQNKRNANWLLRYQFDGHTRWMGLGSALLGDGTTLDEARERARAARHKLRDRIDPLDARRAERAAQKEAAALALAKTMTFKQCAEKYIADNSGAWRNAKHAAQWTSTLARFAYPTIGDLPVATVDTGLVLKVLEQPIKAERGRSEGTLWTARRETASRLRGRIETILGWATVRGYRTGDNPARWKNHIEAAVAEKGKAAGVAHHAALPYADVPAFVAALRGRDGVAARALEFLILTAARTGEVIGAKWKEIDLEVGLWMVPAERMKAHREHRVPLAPDVRKLLRGLFFEDGNEHVFIGPRGSGLSDMSLTAVLRRMGRRDITVHGFRSTFMDWAHEQTAYPKTVIDMALAHAVGDKVEEAYRRGDLLAKRRKLMEAWAVYCASAKAKRGGHVVALRGTHVRP